MTDSAAGVQPSEEPAGIPRRPRIDAHHHLWDVGNPLYTWPTPEHGAIYRTFTIDDLAPIVAEARIDGTVLVQTVNSLEDTDSMLAVAAAMPWVRGVVGWIPLDDAGLAAAELDRRGRQPLRGVRHLIHHEADPDWVVRPAVVAALREVARRGLAFDVVAVFPRHLRHVPALASAVPELTLVIDHLANPPFGSDGWSAWSRQLAEAARHTNVAAKLSGLSTPAGPDWTIDMLRPAIETALDAFGPDRLMFGSDWPVCLTGGTYRDHVVAIETLIAALTPDEQALVMGGTAAAVYRLEDAPPPGVARADAGR